MFENDVFAKSLRPQDVHRGIFTTEDPDMMHVNMIFQYLEASSPRLAAEEAVEEAGSKGANKWESPQLGFDPSLVADFQRFAEYNASTSSQESSPSPTVSLFSDSNAYHVSGGSGLSTPRTLSNRSSKEQSGNESDKLRMATKPNHHSGAANEPGRLTPPPEAVTNSRMIESREAQTGVESTYRLPSTAAAPVIRRCELRDDPERRQNSYNDQHWPSLATVASKYERKSSKSYQNSYRNTMPPPLDTSVRAQNQRGSQEVSPFPYRSVYSPSNSSARIYESRGSQDTFQTSHRNTLPPLVESAVRYIGETHSPNTIQKLNRPQPPPVDPSLRRYESFRISGASPGRYELKDPQEIPVDEVKNKGLDHVVSAKSKSRFTFPNPMRATITSFVDILPHAPPSPAAIPPGSGTAALPPQLRIPTPDFSLPSRPKKDVQPEPLPSLLSIGRRDASMSIPASVLDMARASTPNGKRLSAPSLTIQIPESTRPPPQSVGTNRPALNEALSKVKRDSILARPRPKPRVASEQIRNGGPVPMWEAPAHTGTLIKNIDASESILSRPLPKTVPEFSRLAPQTTMATAPAPRSVPAQSESYSQNHRTADLGLARPQSNPRAKSITFEEPILPRGYPHQNAAPTIPALNFSKTAHVHSSSVQGPASEHVKFEDRQPTRPLNIHRSEESEHTKALEYSVPHAPTTYKIGDPEPAKPLSGTQARWFHDGFCASSDGLQMTMSRRVATFSKLEWAVESTDETRHVKCFTQVNTQSRRTDFFDGTGEPLFLFQRKTGSTRVGKTVGGVVLFSVKNSSFGVSPYWVVNITAGEKDSTKQCIAKGDEELQNVSVTWGGFSMGRISCAPQSGKHTYTIDVSPEMNYAIMAALVTVFDDWRMDHVC